MFVKTMAQQFERFAAGLTTVAEPAPLVPPDPSRCSKRIGQGFEAHIRETLHRQFCFAGVRVEDTSTTPNAMDIRVTLPAVGELAKCSILVECKAGAANNVKPREIANFERDLRRHPDADAAIIVARNCVDVRGGYAKPVPGVPNLSRASARMLYVDRGDLGALTLAIWLAWHRASSAAAMPGAAAAVTAAAAEAGDETLAFNVDCVLAYAADALARQKQVIAGVYALVRQFMSGWHTSTRCLASALVELRESADGRVGVERVFEALTYRASKPSAKARGGQKAVQ